MKWRNIFFLSLPLTVIATALLYEPVSLAIYKISEPYFACPIKTEPGKIVIRNDSHGDGAFGAKRRAGRTHSGIDISSPVGTPVYASKSGLAFRGNVPTGYGKYVMICHPDGFQTMYGHLSGWAILPAQKAARGSLIGFVGKTGNAAGRHIEPHLHFEIKKDGKPIDPQAMMR